MARLSPLLTGLWVAGLALQFILAIAIFVNRLWRKFPIFSAYSLTAFLISVILFVVRTNVHSPYVYFYTYWVCEGFSFLLGFGVVYEVFRQLFSAHPALRRLASRLFIWVLGSLLVAGGVVIYSHSVSSHQALVSGVVVVEEATRVIEVGLLMFLFVFSRVFGLHWRQPVFGIALGLGIFATVELVGMAVFSNVGPVASKIFNPIRALIFDCSMLVWIGYILAPEPATTGELPKREQLEQWNRAVMEFMHQ